jgi:hypothetical protein
MPLSHRPSQVAGSHTPIGLSRHTGLTVLDLQKLGAKESTELRLNGPLGESTRIAHRDDDG